MEKIIIQKPGGYDRLVLQKTVETRPKDNEILVDIHASGVNYADCLVRWGVYDSAKKFVGWPITPGFEYAGIVKAIGPKAKTFKVGDRVVGISLFNAYATSICVPETYIFPLPRNWSFEQAAAMPAVFLTAYHALCQIVVIRPGSKLLVHSAAGGVGTALLQMSRIKGYEAVGVVGSTHKIETAKQFGAVAVIDKSKENLWERADALAPDGFDVVLDANGFSTLKESYKRVKTSGKLIVYGFHSMLPKQGGRLNYIKLAIDYLKTPSFNPLQMTNKNKSLITFNISFLWDQAELIREAMTDILRWIEEGRLQAPAVKVYPLSKVAQAHKDIESGQTVGKLVLVPDRLLHHNA